MKSRPLPTEAAVACKGREGGSPAEARNFGGAACRPPGHLISGHVSGRRDALDFELELVDVARPAQRFLERDESLLIEAEDRLIERLHAVLRGAGGDRAVDHCGPVL